MDEPDQHETTPDPVIAEALEKNKDATDEVKKVADDLLVVHAVLKDELSQDTVTDEGGRAVEQAGELEKRLTQSAELLDEVNDALEQAVQGSNRSSGDSSRNPPTKNTCH